MFGFSRKTEDLEADFDEDPKFPISRFPDSGVSGTVPDPLEDCRALSAIR